MEWVTNSAEAYTYLGLDHSISDEDLVVASYDSIASERITESAVREALQLIAEERKSRLLFFILSTYQHLNNSNVAILAGIDSPKHEQPGLQGEAAGPSQSEEPSSSEAGTLQNEHGEPFGTPGETPEATSTDPMDEVMSPSSSEADFTSSSDEMGTETDFEEEVGGTFFDQICWRCEECSSQVIDGKCPNNHGIQRCQACDWQLLGGSCPKCQQLCEDCGEGLVNGKCLACSNREGEDDDDFIAYDPNDRVWRCIDCHWEVEADNDEDGNCHCLNAKGEAHYHDLKYCSDYEPADSCSSVASSSDEEPNSDDEGFIDDETVIIEGAFDPTVEIIGLAQMLPVKYHEFVHKAAEDARAIAAAGNEEHGDPSASSDDVEIIDAPDAGRSNIVDIEEMGL